MTFNRRAFFGILGGIAALPLIRKTAWADRTAVAVLRMKKVGAREYVLGFGKTMVGPGCTARIAVKPEVDFAPYRMVIPAEIAHAFTVHDLFVGKESQFRHAGPPGEIAGEEKPGISALVWSECGFAPALNTAHYVCAKDRLLAIVVKNISAEPMAFTMAMVGKELVDIPLGPEWKVHEPVREDELLNHVVADARAFAREEGYDHVEGELVDGVFLGKMTKRRPGLLARLLGRRS